MGMDFTAVLRCDLATGAVSRGLDALEAMDRPMPLQAVLHCLHESGFSGFEDWRRAVWVQWENKHEVELPSRPKLPSLGAQQLRLPEGFFVTVAKDSIVAYHTLRWHFFLTELKWRTVMLDALRWFCKEFAAEDCVLAHDCHVVVCGIHDGLSFDEALSKAEREGVGRVNSFDELYIEVEDHSDVAMKPAEGDFARLVEWPRGKPLPRGWCRPTMWDSKGYWRFEW